MTRRWDETGWDFLLADLESRLNPGGRIFFDLNAAYHGNYYTPKILDVFLQHGGVIERNTVLFSTKNLNPSQRPRICV